MMKKPHAPLHLLALEHFEMIPRHTPHPNPTSTPHLGILHVNVAMLLPPRPHTPATAPTLLLLLLLIPFCIPLPPIPLIFLPAVAFCIAVVLLLPAAPSAPASAPALLLLLLLVAVTSPPLALQYSTAQS
jgi:hypothetical protein